MSRGVYWQTFTNALDVSKYEFVILAAIHFGVEDDDQVYMHLNDKAPCAFQDVFDVLAREKGYRQKFQVGLMIGGAGGGFDTLFARFEECIELLRQFLESSNLFDFVDLDPETPDSVRPEDLVRLHSALPCTCTAAPITLPSTFWNRVRANMHISRWHVQAYDAEQWAQTYFDALVDGGWPLHRVVLGYTASTFDDVAQRDAAFDLARRNNIRAVVEWDPPAPSEEAQRGTARGCVQTPVRAHAAVACVAFSNEVSRM